MSSDAGLGEGKGKGKGKCRKYVKSQKARGGYRHTSTHKDTSTQ